MDAENLIKHAESYCERHGMQLTERLGFGIHGMVFVAKNKNQPGKSAIKIHREHEPFHRELAIYKRLLELRIGEILGFKVPQLIRSDFDLLILEMTIVVRPFVLDFAGAYLDGRPDFSPEVWEEWEFSKREQFEGRWNEVRRVLNELEVFGIYMIDVSPSNIAFSD